MAQAMRRVHAAHEAPGFRLRSEGGLSRRLRAIVVVAIVGLAGALVPPASVVGAFQQCVFAPRGLVGWWPGDGNTNDLSASHIKGVVLTRNNVVYVPGRVGRTFALNPNDRTAVGVSLGDPKVLHLQNFTIEAWIKRARTDVAGDGPSHEGAILVYGIGGYGLGLSANGQLFLTKVQIDGVSDPTPRVILKDVWYHVAVAKYRQRVTLYVNGVPAVASTSYASTFTFGTKLAIGTRVELTDPAYPNAHASFAGYLDEVSVFNRALSKSEIQMIYGARGAGKCKPSSTQAPDGGTLAAAPLSLMTSTMVRARVRKGRWPRARRSPTA